jgi:hypothetical protein
LHAEIFDGGCHRRDTLRGLVSDDYVGTSAGEGDRDAAADSLSRAGDDRNAIEQRFRA